MITENTFEVKGIKPMYDKLFTVKVTEAGVCVTQTYINQYTLIAQPVVPGNGILSFARE